jgi:hypothetical protein
MIDFKKYDNENPQIWEQFKKYAFEAKVKGFTNYSAKGIFEIIRWHTAVSGNDAFKLNNNYHADYARKMMHEFPLFEGFFRVRELKASRSSEQLPKLSEVTEAKIGKRYLTDDGVVVECIEKIGCKDCYYFDEDILCKKPYLYQTRCGGNMRSDEKYINFQNHDKSQHLSQE